LKRFETSSPQETRALGERIAEVLEPGDVLGISGELGAGKTVLIQGLAAGLGAEGRVQSPSFVLVRTYRARLPIKHVDLYRLDERGVAELHLAELYDPAGVMLVEWAERADYLPGAVSTIRIQFVGADDMKRHIGILGALEARLR